MSNKITGIDVDHSEHETKWKRGRPTTKTYAEISVYAVVENGRRHLISRVRNLDSTRLHTKEERCKRYFNVLVGMSLQEAGQQVFTFGQNLSWSEVKVCELY